MSASGQEGSPVLVRWLKGEDEDKINLITNDQDAAITHVNENVSNREEAKLHDVPSKGKAKTPAIIYVITGFSIIGGFLFGYDTGVIAGALLELDNDFNLSATQKELVVSITVAAAALGALGGGLLNEKLGRKKAIMVASAIFGVGAVIMAGAPLASWGWSIVLIGRFTVGIGIGLASMTVPIYLAECAPIHLRGRLTVADNMAITAGQFVAATIDYCFSYVGQGWRLMLGLAVIPAVVRFVAFFFLPESPRWLVSRGKRDTARTVLLQLRGGGGRREEVEEDVERELKEIQENLEESARENAHNVVKKLWIMLRTRHLLMALVVGCGLQIIQQLSGINTVMYYSATIIRMVGVTNDHSAIGMGAVVAFWNFIFTLVGLYFVEKSGRRKLILFSLCGVIIGLGLLGLMFYLANAVSPAAFAPARLNTNDSSTDGDCQVYSKTCSIWKNCDDCVIRDNCNYCVFNGSYNSRDAIGLCVSSSDSNLYSNDQCTIPNGIINYTENDKCYTFEAENVTAKTYEACPSDFSWLAMPALVIYIVAFSPGMGPVPWTVNAEIYPNWARSVGNSVATTSNWVSNFLVSISFLHLTRYLTRYGCTLSLLSVDGCSYSYYFLKQRGNH